MSASVAGTGPGMKAALEQCLARHGAPSRVGVAVSGGGDSVALLAAAARLDGVVVEAVTVDHGLRAEAAAEAASVAALCMRLGVAHATLRWDAAERRGNLQQAARHARQRLIGEWARARGIEAVLLGHTLDDQAETVLMRLARGSGVDGLCGMDEAVRLGGTLWLRPFLALRRAVLRDWLAGRGIGWCDDPSNEDERYGRTRARRALAALAPLGIDAAGLVRTASRLRRARAALEAETWGALASLGRDERGAVVLDRAALALEPEIRDRLFAWCLMHLTGAPHRPRLEAVQRWIAEGAAHGATLAGCVLRPCIGGLWLYREARAVSGLKVPVDQVWDGRWRARPPEGAGACPGAEIGALGAEGMGILSAQARAGLHPHWRDTGMPAGAVEALPALWQGARLIAAPLAFWPEGWQITADPVVPVARAEGLSH